jgi:hypothetical protein
VHFYEPKQGFFTQVLNSTFGHPSKLRHPDRADDRSLFTLHQTDLIGASGEIRKMLIEKALPKTKIFNSKVSMHPADFGTSILNSFAGSLILKHYP